MTSASTIARTAWCTADETKIVVQGLDGYIIAEKHGQLLVCQLKEEQRIKEFGK